MRKIGLRGGHSSQVLGAVGLRNEYWQMQTLYTYVKAELERRGYEVINCNSNGCSASQELSEGANKANNNSVDLFLSLHMNAYNNSAHGTECWVSSQGCRAEEIARRIVNNMANLGFVNRGVNYNSGYFEMRHINAPNIIVETCFCDSETDIAIWSATSWETIANAIVDGIDGGSAKPVEPSKPVEQEESLLSKARKFVGDRCGELQTKLIACGYNCGGYGADGKFGQGTLDSLIQFQKDNGLSADGLAGDRTFAKLDEKKNAQSIGWKKNNTGWWYVYDNNGAYYTNQWRQLDNEWYYFNENGYALCNQWFKHNESWYYFQDTCKMAHDGWLKIGDKWSYFEKNGVAKCDEWFNNNEHWYYIKSDCYTAENQWLNIDDDAYYFTSGGALLTDCTTPDGYLVDKTGAWVR